MIAIAELRRGVHKEIELVHHDDADGLCSASIIKAALEREGFRVKTLCLEKVYPEVIEDLHKRESGAFTYCDIGSSHADLISRANLRNNLVIILDHHHDPPEATNPHIFDLNLERFGFDGETEFSGATCSYFFAKTLNSANFDLCFLPLVASREIPTDLAGLNGTVLDEAIREGVVRAEGKAIRIVKLGMSVNDLFAKLQVLGAVGYYEGGPELGIQICLSGITDDAKVKIRDLEERRKSVNKQVIGRLFKQRLNETDHLQWFDVGDMYNGMGTKVIGQFCSFLSYQMRLIKPDKYILGFMNVPPEVPNWEGKLKGPYVKVSIRTPKDLRKMIDEGRKRDAVDLMSKASQGFGLADGHKYAANVVMKVDRKETLLRNADALAVM
jgi:single-stranded DNA-specific DHH superfamily exonuclease